MLNRSQLLLTAVHEVMPGHYAQLTALRRLASGLGPLRLRRQSTAFLEGWAAYAEQTVAVEQAERGAAADRLQVLALRAQLLRLARLLGVLRLHAAPAGAPSPSNRLEDVVRLFSEECLLDDYAARREAERLCYDTSPALAALGYLQLVQLRSDHRGEQADKHSTQAFHDSVLSQGALPVVALRKILLSKAGPSLRPPAEDTREESVAAGTAKE
jgi:uncharacterized protein (DUF885 family)